MAPQVHKEATTQYAGWLTVIDGSGASREEEGRSPTSTLPPPLGTGTMHAPGIIHT